MLDFAHFKICKWKNAYCLQDYFAQTILIKLQTTVLRDAISPINLTYLEYNYKYNNRNEKKQQVFREPCTPVNPVW